MKNLLRWGMLLYPARWRARYGEEFLALVEDLRPQGGDVWDVVKGAFRMRMTNLGFVKIVAVFALGGRALPQGVVQAGGNRRRLAVADRLARGVVPAARK